ncbi:MAG: type II toxin-antitoxin system HipA family toxin [Rhizobium sp.]|nr:type II toxin-antitoxin system HipA family toxin [Rhizobium sp.]
MKHVEVIEVRIWGKRVGAVARDPSLDAYVFEYADSWRGSGVELSPFLLPLGAPGGLFSFPALDPEAFHRLPGLLADALPDDFGNQLINGWMASHGVRADQVTTLDRLAYMGRRGMGALEFKPMRGASAESAAPIEMKALVEEARKAVHGDLGGDREARAALANIIRVGTSAGGARAKAVVAWNPATNELRSGQFDVAPGFGHWLLKFDGMGADKELGQSQCYGRREFAYHLMATTAGVTMSECRLMEENGRAHFMTRRFDRDGNRKIHVQTLAALQHMSHRQRRTHAYESLFMTAHQLGLSSADLQQLFLRMAFNVAGKNHDDHAKNFAFLMREGGPWELAPAYDVTHAYNPAGEWTRYHLMGVAGKFDGITAADLKQVAARFSIPGAGGLIDQVNAAVARWPEFARAAGLPAADRDEVGRLLVRL